MSLFGGFMSLSLCLAPAQDSEKKVKLKDLPPAVQKTVQEQSQGAKKGIRAESKIGA
jgi:hypothetical protein